MITQGAKITTQCADCGGALVRDVGQFLDRGRLCWGTEASCRTCSAAWCEEGDGGPTPEEIRQALLAKHGLARLHLVQPELSLVPVLRALREAHGLALAQARAMAVELKTASLAGTLVEVEFTAAALQDRSVAVTVETLGG
ncbi:hypothetical protein ACFV84_12000 [Kitasatospora sp. NPDC059811]|uniref:hypothetical protein n=1 Tax=Streptomycetaceae TaxID=2062 RepID=UPI0007AF5974|nr:hypothetical protein [Streptomyces sp. MJM8645]